MEKNESEEAPRAIVFYGRSAYEVACRVNNELSKVGHLVKIVNAKDCLAYAKEYATLWLTKKQTIELDMLGVVKYQKEKIIDEIKKEIIRYLDQQTATWRDLTRKIGSLRNLCPEYQRELKKWFDKFKPTNEKEKLQKEIEKIAKYLAENPETKWSEIYRKFHLSRKTREEREQIKEVFGL